MSHQLIHQHHKQRSSCYNNHAQQQNSEGCAKVILHYNAVLVAISAAIQPAMIAFVAISVDISKRS